MTNNVEKSKDTAKNTSKKKMSKREIRRKIMDPNTTNAERIELLEKLYEDIEFKSQDGYVVSCGGIQMPDYLKKRIEEDKERRGRR